MIKELGDMIFSLVEIASISKATIYPREIFVSVYLRNNSNKIQCRFYKQKGEAEESFINRTTLQIEKFIVDWKAELKVERYEKKNK